MNKAGEKDHHKYVCRFNIISSDHNGDYFGAFFSQFLRNMLQEQSVFINAIDCVKKHIIKFKSMHLWSLWLIIRLIRLTIILFTLTIMLLWIKPLR